MDNESNPFRIASLPGKRPGQRVVTVTGRLVYDKSREFSDLVRRETDPFVILDLSNVSNVDSSGVGSLMRIHASFAFAKQRLVLVGPNEKVLNVLEITQVIKLLKVFRTIEEAEAFGMQE
jgi:anti-anti-sigma factor